MIQPAEYNPIHFNMFAGNNLIFMAMDMVMWLLGQSAASPFSTIYRKVKYRKREHHKSHENIHFITNNSIKVMLCTSIDISFFIVSFNEFLWIH